ncbi:conjugal transfer protein TraG, partial [Tannerella sp. oral taxon BU063 isolate Cell 1/3]
FHAEIVVDTAKVSAEMKAYRPIPVIADFRDASGGDTMKASIDANYRQIKQEILSLVDSEIARIKSDPKLQGLMKG